MQDLLWHVGSSSPPQATCTEREVSALDYQWSPAGDFWDIQDM